MSSELQSTPDYQNLIDRISETYDARRRRALRVVNSLLLETYWQIGHDIVEFEQGGKARADYGTALLHTLSRDLTRRHGKGFSRSNLIYMRLLYLEYPISQKPSDLLSWSHYVELLRIDDRLERGFYEQQSIKERWSVPELQCQKKSSLFLRLAAGKDKSQILQLARHYKLSCSRLLASNFIPFFLLAFSLLMPAPLLFARGSDDANNLDKKAEELHEHGKYNEALPLYERVLAMREKNLGPQHKLTAIALTNLASNYSAMADFGRARELFERALAIFEKILGPQHPDTALCLTQVASSCTHTDDSAKAMELFERALAIREKALGTQHRQTISSLMDLALLNVDMGFHLKGRELFERILTIKEKALGPQHPDVANALDMLAAACRAMGDNASAVELNERVLAIKEKALGLQHPETANALANLANTYQSSGENAKALPYIERALVIKEKALGLQHPDIADTIMQLASNYSDMGDNARALELNERAVAIKGKALGLQHSDTADNLDTEIILSELAYNYNLMGDNAKALDLYERVLAIKKKFLGPESLGTGETLYKLATTYGLMGDQYKSRELFERSIGIHEKTVGPESLFMQPILAGLAWTYEVDNDFSKARGLHQRILRVYEKNLGSDHPYAAASLYNLARNTYLMDDVLLACNYAIRETSVKQRIMQSILTLDERSRLAWQKANLDYWTACVLPPDSLARLALTQKGIVLDSLAEDRAMALAAGSSGESGATLQKIKSLQGRLSKIAFELGKEAEANKLQDEIGLLQREITSKYLGRDRQRASANMTMSDVVPALAEGGVLVDFIQFDDPKLKGDDATCLGGIITGEDNAPAFVRIDGGTAINRSIDALRAAINQGNSIEVEAQTKFLSEKLWAPIAAKIPEGTKRLFLCPDANLNFLSFAALLESDGRFVAEKYPITYIGSARDLAKKPSGKISKSMALIANPQFDAANKIAKTNALVAMRSAEADVFGSIALPPLPGTEAEAASLQALAAESGWQTKSYLGKDATETSVRNTKKPGVLHLATHGFYLNSFTPPGPEGSRGMSVVGVKETTEEKKKNEKGVDPMRASGVAFTGAQQTLTSWSQRKAPNPETDGVLTAEEVGALRLDGTWMVVLSACETGVGEARSGEGVFGLRRAFMIAGAQNLLMTLWPVADETTAKIMTDFYKEAFATGDAAGSLAKVQRDWLVKLRQERGLLAAVREAGPFAMVTMTNPNTKVEFVTADR